MTTETPAAASTDEFCKPQAPPTQLSVVFDCLPAEVLYTIFEFIPVTELEYVVRSLNRKIREHASAPELWEQRLAARYHIVDLLRLDPCIIAERRSKGRVQRARMMGTQKQFILRTVSLETTNAGKDDGVPTSCLREISLLSTISHPHIATCYGAKVEGSQLRIVSEYVENSLLTHMAQLGSGTPSASQRGPYNKNVVKSLMFQLFSAVACLHQRGVIHRNIKSDNILIDSFGYLEKPLTLKLCDLAMGRAIDIPLGMYTPEDPKERDRSYREQRRLYNRAPEIILRQPVYGLEADMWSVGCVFLEITLGAPPFRCESEIGLLLSTLQLCGTPDVGIWNRISTSAKSFLRLPDWAPIDFRAVAATLHNPTMRALGLKSDYLAPYKSQTDSVKMLLEFGSALGISALHLLERLLIIPGCFRVSATKGLSFPYFHDVETDTALHPEVQQWLDSWYQEQQKKDGTQGMSLASILHYQRFIEEHEANARALKQNATATPESNAFWAVLKTMDDLSSRNPINLSAVVTAHIDYVEERKRLQKSPMALHDMSTVSTENQTSSSYSPYFTIPIFAPESASSSYFALQRRTRSKDVVGGRTAEASFAGFDQKEENAFDVAERWHRGIDASTSSSSPEDCVEEDYLNVEYEASPTLLRYASYTTCSLTNVTAPSVLLSSSLSGNLAADGQEGLQHNAAVCRPVRSPELNTQSSEASGERRSRFKRPISTGEGDKNERLSTSFSTEQETQQRSFDLHDFTTHQQPSCLFEWNRDYTKRISNVSQESLRPAAAFQKGIVDARSRLDVVNYLLGIQPHFYLKSQTVHLAVAYFDRYICIRSQTADPADALCLMKTVNLIPTALACLKIADLNNEMSKEYYKQDNITEYATFATLLPGSLGELQDHEGRKLSEAAVTSDVLLAEEKRVLNALQFNIAVPTVCWFLDAFLSVAKLLHMTCLVDYCHYLADLALYSSQLVALRPALKAQTILLIGCCSLFRPTIKRSKSQHCLTTLSPSDPDYPKYLQRLLQHLYQRRDLLCEYNTVWSVLDCVALMRDVLINGRRYFEAMKLKSVERTHSWAAQLSLPTPMIPIKALQCILPSSQDIVLLSFS